MKSKKIEKSQSEMGLNSMVGYLSSIAKDESSSNSVINLMRNDFSKFFDETKPFFTNAIKIQNYLLKNLSAFNNKVLSNISSINSKFDLLLENISHSENPIQQSVETQPQQINISIFSKINSNVEDIRVLLKNYIESKFKRNQNQNMSVLKTFGKTDFESISTYIVETIATTFSTMIIVTNEILNNIKDELINIRSIISNINLGNLSPESNDKKIKSTKASIDYTEISEGITKIDKSLSKDFLNRIDSFNKSFNNLISVDGKRIRNFSMQLAIVGTAMKMLSFRLLPLSRIFSRLSLSILFFSLVVISPFFILGASVIVGFIWGLSKAFGSNKELITSLKDFVKWFTVLSLTLLLFKVIPYDAVWKFLIVFTALVLTIKFLGATLRDTFTKTNKIKVGNKKGFSAIFFDITKGIFYLGTGLLFIAGAMAIFSMISWSTLGSFLGFVAALGVVLMIFHGTRSSKITIGGKMNGSPMLMSFGQGMFFIALSLAVFALISFAPMFKLLLFIGALGLILKFLYSSGEVKQSKTNLGVFKTTKGAPPTLTGFAIGMFLLSLSLLMFTIVPWEGIAKSLVVLVGISLALTLLKKAIPTEKQLFRFGLLAGVMIIFASAFFIIGKSNITLSIFLMFAGIIAGMVALCVILSAASVSIFIGVGVLIGLGISLLVFGFALQKIAELTIEKEKIDNFVNVMGSLCIGIFKITGYALLAVTGAILMLPVAIISLLIAATFWLISKMEIKTETFENFKIGLTTLAEVYTDIALKAIPAAIGAVLMIPVVASALATSILLTVLSSLPINTDNLNNFKIGLSTLADVYMSVALKAIPAAIGATLMIPVVASALIAAGLFGLIGAIDIETDNISNFGILLKELTKSYNDLSIIQLGKSAIKAGLLLPLLGSSYLAAVVFKKIGELEVPPTAMDNFTYLLHEFITKSVEAINSSEDGLKNADKGLKSLAKLVGVAGDLVDVVQAFATMTYNVYEVKDGKLVLVAQKKITDTELAGVGKSIGILLKSLIEPLTIISSDDKEWNFSGTKVTNPFAGGWFGTDKNSGVNRIKKIGEAFLPLVEFINKFATLEIAADPTKLDFFNSAFGSIINLAVSSLEKLKGFENKSVSKISENLNKFLSAFSDNIDTEKINTLDKMMTNLINNLTDDTKWEKINNNLTILKNQFTDIAKAVNSIDIEKATAFERNVKLLVDNNNGENLKETVEQLKELMGLVKNQQESTNRIAESAETTSKSVEKLVAPSKQDENDNDFRSVADLLSQAVNKLVEISGNTSGMSSRLNRPLKVIPVETNGNQI